MKKNRILCVLICAAVLLPMLRVSTIATEPTETTAPTTATTQPDVSYQDGMGDSSIANGCHSVNAQVPLLGTGRLLETAGAAILYEVNSDSMLYSWNPDQQVPPASLVKIMTCLIALENSTLTETVTVTSTAMATLPKDTTFYLAVGETWSMEDMLYCLMVAGYNDAAAVIAEHVAGSQKAFVAMMNSRAQEIGCTGTVFTNATGFHDDAQLSTARDLVKILKEALANEQFMTFFSETVFRLPKTEYADSRYLETTNYMMTQTVTAEYFDWRVTGGRTGVTDSRERCLIVTAESNGLHYIAIVMCAKATMDEEGKIVRFGSYEEVKELLKLGFDGYRVTQVLDDKQILTQYPVAGGENSVTVGPSNTLYTVLPEDITTVELSYRYQQSLTGLTAPVESGMPINTVQVWYGNVCVAQSPVITKNSSAVYTVTDPSAGIEKTGEGLKITLRIIGILVAVVAVIAGVFYLLRLARRASRRAQHRRRRANRRRSR